MTDKEATLTHLTEGLPGITQRDAELRLLDEDLWLLGPEGRVGLEPEEAVEQWSEAVRALGAFIHVAEHMNEATYQALVDAKVRAGEALMRARERVLEIS
jgi:hypothetical protein